MIVNPFPSGVTFSGPAFSEPRLIGLAYAFEQATRYRRPPSSTPPLAERHHRAALNMASHSRLGSLGIVAVAALAAARSGAQTPTSQPGSPIVFENVSDAAGRSFVLDQHPTPEKNLVETVAGGLAVFDYDGDGLPDIFFTNGASLPALR